MSNVQDNKLPKVDDAFLKQAAHAIYGIFSRHAFNKLAIFEHPEKNDTGYLVRIQNWGYWVEEDGYYDDDHNWRLADDKTTLAAADICSIVEDLYSDTKVVFTTSDNNWLKISVISK